VKKPNIAAAIALGRTPLRRAAEEEEAVPGAAQSVSTPASAETTAEPLPESPRVPEVWAGASSFNQLWAEARDRKKKPGPQRRSGDYQKRIFTLPRDTSDYVNEAWRSYRTRDGHLVDSMSEFVTAVLAEHRDRHSR
jgi:hypothetical protein